MNREDIEYRQGRTAKQVQSNEEISFYAISGMIFIVAILAIISLYNNLVL